MPSTQTLDQIVVKPKRFQCSRCQRFFARLEHLQRHERTRKPFACNRCESKFTRSDLLIRHERLSHNKVGEESQPQLDNNALAGQLSAASRRRSRKPRPRNSSHGSTGLLSSIPDEQLNRPISAPSPLHPGLLTEASQFYLAPSTSCADYRGDLSPLGAPDESLDPLCNFLEAEPLNSFPFPFTFDPAASAIPDELEMIIHQPSHPVRGSFSRFCSRLPSVQPDQDATELNPDSFTIGTVRATRRRISDVSSLDRQALLQSIEREFSASAIGGFQLPTTLSLTRYIRAYTEGFHEHLPFLHLSTLEFQNCSAELVLAMAAVGAQYCFEPEKGVELFHAARAIANERIRKRDTAMTSVGHDLTQTAQALLILMAMATWSKHKEILREALAIQSILASIVREDGLGTMSDQTPTDWKEWTRHESRLRTKFIVFCFFNLHCIVYDIPPLILNSELHMRLPCGAAEFRAETASAWEESRGDINHQPCLFQDATKQLFSAEGESGSHSALGNYILMHAIIQQIFLTRQTARCSSSGLELTEQQTRPLETALRNWQRCWELSPESSLDPSDPNGPVAFNSTALLRLAYIRLSMDTGPGRALGTRDPAQIAQALRDTPTIQRSPKLTKALLHSVHALSIPIKIGIRLVARTQTFVWSIQHSLCSLECALLLSKWLEAVSNLGPLAVPEQQLTMDEMRVLSLVKTMLDETELGTLGDIWLSTSETARELNVGVLRAWATIFRGSQTWAIVDVIGSSLDLYANMMAP
ncbi:hypothetical protein QBC44DRAFT_403968 [Cladorrhinum sp. PSN332]|nr:hypothetical protein QBC44DRAFT_403968 [Cladorrhinum sp. PSN332]